MDFRVAEELCATMWNKETLYQYIALAVFVVPFVWHLARGRFKVAFFVLGVYVFFMVLILVLAVVLLRIEGGAL